MTEETGNFYIKKYGEFLINKGCKVEIQKRGNLEFLKNIYFSVEDGDLIHLNEGGRVCFKGEVF